MKFLIAAFLFSQMAFAKGICDFPVPPFQIEEHQTTGIDRHAYDHVLDQVEKKYVKVFFDMGYRFSLHRSWSDGTVNAQAWWSGNTCHVEIFGGLARYPGISAAAIRQVTLHEIGHCIGGAPFYPGENMSCEGQADYYSAVVGCKNLKVGCRNSSKNLARALAKMAGEPKPWRPGPPLPEVNWTYCEHPDAQCRLNTFDAGLLGDPRPRCWFKP